MSRLIAPLLTMKFIMNTINECTLNSYFSVILGDAKNLITSRKLGIPLQ